jgi:hypothetical protein
MILPISASWVAGITDVSHHAQPSGGLAFCTLFSELLKDGLQEVPKGDNWPRRHLLSRKGSERHFCPRAIQKGYKNQISQLEPWNHQFLGPSACPHVAFLFSSLRIKSFWPLLLESTCAFILRVDPRTLNTWNSCVSSVHHFQLPVVKHCRMWDHIHIAFITAVVIIILYYY